MRVGQVRRRDANEAELVKALEQMGVTVTKVSGKGAPDVICSFRGRDFCFEIKGPKGRYTEAQQHTRWPIIRTVSDALTAMGYLG